MMAEIIKNPLQAQKSADSIVEFATLENTQAQSTRQTPHFECVFASEIDKYAQQTYTLNYADTALYGDITLESTQNQIPRKFDMLCAGFPCQAFSIAGLQKGFKDTRGTLFFEIAKIAKKHRPKVLFLENVKNLLNHEKKCVP